MTGVPGQGFHRHERARFGDQAGDEECGGARQQVALGVSSDGADEAAACVEAGAISFRNRRCMGVNEELTG
jgi:hypothetical protein